MLGWTHFIESMKTSIKTLGYSITKELNRWENNVLPLIIEKFVLINQ